jgi:hypothetical protein
MGKFKKILNPILILTSLIKALNKPEIPNFKER